MNVRLAPEVADFVDADSQFWVMQPRVNAQGVTGLQTVLSGVHIQGSWNSEIGAEARSFKAQERPRLSDAGDAVLVDAFINAPTTGFTTATRFWDASGFSFTLGTSGPRLDVESLAALVGGAVSFDTLVPGGRKPQPETTPFLKTAMEAVLHARLTTASILTGAG